MFAAVLRIGAMILSGVGLTHLFDRVVAPKLPEGIKPEESVNPGLGKKMIWTVVLMVAGAMLTKWIGKKFNIKLLK